ncbi:MAG: penicillin-binding transpeptidase domain-containing protein [Oscillospiraceae bacterium]|nr:penicillin-binding transpeptidase domain-containing protein [Oscillospiraceae bacterium]
MNLLKLPGDKKRDKLNFIIRFTALIGFLFIFGFIGITKLMKLQIVEGSHYASLSQRNFTAQQTVQAARGQIADANGVLLNANKTVYKVIVQRAFFPYGQENEIIERTLAILKEYDETWTDSIPVSTTAPFEFYDVNEKTLETFKKNIGVNLDATVENCVKALFDNFNISEDYDADTARAIAGVRYEMKLRDFSHINRFTLAVDISFQTVVNLKERSISLPGVDIIVEPMRVYNEGLVAAHTRGTIGVISAEEYEELKEQGYDLNDIIGKSGIESAMEAILRGENGTRTIVRNLHGIAVSDEITIPTKPGNSVMLTLDSRFQQDLQNILENHISWLRTLDQTYDNTGYNRRGLNTKGGAVSVIEVKTGRVLGMASFPSYDINEYITDYEAVLNADLDPLFNRAAFGRYRPGSSFKTLTSVAGLYNNVIDRNSTISCGGTYHAFSDFKPKCHELNGHGSLNVMGALKWSCNIFYYETGRRMGIDALVEAAQSLGIGTNLGLESGSAAGRMTTPAIYEELMGYAFNEGDTVQAAIGQSETLVTPLHLAVMAASIAGGGVRYKPYIVDSVWNYDYSELIYKTEPLIVDTYATDRPDVYQIVNEGMVSVSDTVNWPPNHLNWQFDYLPYRVASKTGTAQVGDGTYNSTVVGFYPAEDPVIAFAVVLENSDFSRYMIRNIIDAYFYNAYEPDINEDGLIASPWKRWDEEKRNRLTGN